MAKAKSTNAGLIPAVRYLRKSTKGERADGRERQEHSIEQQRIETDKLAAGRYVIIREYIDEGVSGWKRDGKRPDFDRMLRDAKERGDFRAVLCDDLDRFSRADVMEVFADLTQLAAGNVRTLHCANQGEYNLGGERGDIGKIIKLVVDIHGGNEFSRKLGRRIALTRRNEAREGKRSGGKAPYGYRNDGQGGLELGDVAEVEVVRSIFGRFVDECCSLLHIASDLNERGVKPPKGKRWSNQTVKNILQNEAYRGTFVYNLKKSGEFFIVDERGEVVEAPPKGSARQAWRVTQDGVFRHDGTHVPIVALEVFARAQERLASFAHYARLRTRKNCYPLTGVLICDHCGGRLYGVTVSKSVNGRRYERVEYRCEGHTRNGQSVCGYHTVREDRILPFLAQRLAHEVNEAHQEILRPKVEMFIKDEPEGERVRELEQQVAELQERIRQGGENLLPVKNDRLRRTLSETLEHWQSDCEALEAELEAARGAEGSGDWGDLTNVDLQELGRWIKWTQKLIHVPILKGTKMTWPCEPGALREVFRQLGAEVRLRWTCEEKRWGREVRKYHRLATGCRYRLGKSSGPLRVNDRVRKAPTAGRCSGIRAADRCDSRRDTD